MSATIKTLMEGHVHELNKLLDFIRWQRTHGDEKTVRLEYEREMSLGDRVEAMSWGKKYEPEAINHYELSRAIEVIQPGFVSHPDFPDLIGDSTDFIECDDGTVNGTPKFAAEVKCPKKSENHMKYLRYGMPAIYYNQTQGHMEVHGVQLGKFVSYDPRHRIEADKLYVQILHADEAWQLRFRERAEEFAHHLKRGSKFEHKIGGVKDGIPSMF